MTFSLIPPVEVAPPKIVETTWGYKEVEGNYELAWEVGYEYVGQEGTNVFTVLREDRGWTQEDVEQLTGGMVPIPIQMMLEDYPIGGHVDVDELVHLARIYGLSPGGLLDLIFVTAGQRILDERKLDESVEN